MFKDFFSVNRQSPGITFLYREFGKNDEKMNKVIEEVPRLGAKVWEGSNIIMHDHIKPISQEQSRKFGVTDYFSVLSAVGKQHLHLEVISFMLYFIFLEINNYLQNVEKCIILTQAVNMDVLSKFGVPQGLYLKYAEFKDYNDSPEARTKKFSLEISSVLRGKPDVALGGSIKRLAPHIEDASRLMTRIILFGAKQ